MTAHRNTDTGDLLCTKCDKEVAEASITAKRTFWYDSRPVQPKPGDFCVSCCVVF